MAVERLELDSITCGAMGGWGNPFRTPRTEIGGVVAWRGGVREEVEELAALVIVVLEIEFAMGSG